MGDLKVIRNRVAASAVATPLDWEASAYYLCLVFLYSIPLLVHVLVDRGAAIRAARAWGPGCPRDSHPRSNSGAAIRDNSHAANGQLKRLYIF
jgi:hypothetical protein